MALSDLVIPTEDEATQAVLDLLSATNDEPLDPMQPDNYTGVPCMSSSPPGLTPYDILQSLAVLQQQDHSLRPSSASYHPQPTRSGRAPAPVPAQEAEEAIPEDLKAYIEFPSDSESDDPDFKPRSRHKGKRKRLPEASSPSEEEDEDDEEGEYLIEEDANSGDDEVVKAAARARPAPPRGSAAAQIPATAQNLGKIKTPPTRPMVPLPSQKRQALTNSYAAGSPYSQPPSPGSPRVKSYDSVPVRSRGARKTPSVVHPSEEMETMRKKRKALANKIVYERKKLEKMPRTQPPKLEHKYQELLVANLELQKRNSELVWRLQALGEDVEADSVAGTW